MRYLLELRSTGGAGPAVAGNGIDLAAEQVGVNRLGKRQAGQRQVDGRSSRGVRRRGGLQPQPTIAAPPCLLAVTERGQLFRRKPGDLDLQSVALPASRRKWRRPAGRPSRPAWAPPRSDRRSAEQALAVEALHAGLVVLQFAEREEIEGHVLAVVGQHPPQVPLGLLQFRPGNIPQLADRLAAGPPVSPCRTAAAGRTWPTTPAACRCSRYRRDSSGSHGS